MTVFPSFKDNDTSCHFCLNAIPSKLNPHNQRGVHLVELAIIIPVLMVLLLGIFDLTRIAVGHSAVRTAATIGARRAIGLSRPENNWRAFGGVVNSYDTTQLVVGVSSPYFTNIDSNVDWYDNRNGFAEISAIEMKGIAYANLQMSETVGQARFPCEEKGCFSCYTARGSVDFDTLFRNSKAVVISKALGISCDFRVPLMTSGLTFGFTPKFLTVSATALIPVDNYVDLEYAVP